LHKFARFVIFLGQKSPELQRILKKIVIAIDGPAASGKSTTARLVAEQLGYLYIDTGAMYRAVALKVLQQRVDPANEKTVEAILGTTSITLKTVKGQLRTFLDGVDVTEEIRSREVARAASIVSAYRKVREGMVKEQRRYGKDGGVVLEGRDIGTVVFPEAQLKIFLTASLEKRAMRRERELLDLGLEADVDSLRREIAQRDRMDATRVASPLTKAPGAIEVDTSKLSIDEQVNLVVEAAKKIIRDESHSR
jgi:cytidylate kinase